MRIVVIGMGYLARYIIPCYKRLLGDLRADNILGIKATERNLEETRRLCGFPVQAGGTAAALDAMQPDVIVVAVKPSQVEEMIRTDLLPYVTRQREKGQPLPDIYSFVAGRTSETYTDVLGLDVHAACMIPNMVDSIEGHYVAPIAVSFVSFDPRAPWPEFNRRRLLDFLSATGEVVEIDPQIAIPFLSFTCACHLMFEFNYIAQDALREIGVEATLAQTASGYRQAFRPLFEDEVVKLVPEEKTDFSPEAQMLMLGFIRSWYDGMMDFAREEGIPYEAARRNVCGTMEVYQIEAQLESREQLVENTRHHATPGGFLEKVMLSYAAMAENGWKQLWREGLKRQLEAEEFEFVRVTARRIASAVAEHGRSMKKK